VVSWLRQTGAMIEVTLSSSCPACGEPALVDMSTNVERRFECSWCDEAYVGEEQTKHL